MLGLPLTKLTLGGAAAAVLTATLASGAFAQVPSQTAPPKPGPQRHEEMLGALATKLGKSPAEVRAAIVAVEKEMVARAVQAGRLTQDQATRLNERIDQSGGRPFLRGPNLDRQPWHPSPVRQATANVAQFLGMAPRELADALRSGKSLAQVAQEKGKSREQLKQHILGQAKAKLDQAVQAGRLTRERADRMLGPLSVQVDKLIDRVHKGRGGERSKPSA